MGVFVEYKDEAASNPIDRQGRVPPEKVIIDIYFIREVQCGLKSGYV
jgi:hypothetical protein